MNNGIVKYQAPTGATISVKLDPRTKDFWLTVGELAAGYGCSERIVYEHLQHIFAEGELDEKVIVRESRTKSKGRPVRVYHRAAAIAVGMRVGTPTATAFRQWIIALVEHHEDSQQTPVVQFMLDRYAVQKNPPPDGYWGVFAELHSFATDLYRRGVTADKQAYIDISIGQAWSKFWNASQLQGRIQWTYEYPDSFPQAASNPHEIWAYPEDALPLFRKWMRDHYVGEGKLERYLAGKGVKQLAAPSKPVAKKLPAKKVLRRTA